MNGPRPSSTGAAVGKGIGFGCGGIFLLGSLVISSFTSDYSGFLFFLTVYIILIVVSVRSGKNRKPIDYTIPATTAAESVSSPAISFDSTPPPARPTPPVASGGVLEGYLQSPICIHSFMEDGFDGRGLVVCPCGYTFKRYDLIEYRDLLNLRNSVDAKISAAVERIRVSSYPNSASAQSTSVATPAIQPVQPVIPAKPAKPAKVRAERPKVTLSLQQWLIMGAAALVIVAGSVFVSTNIDTLPQWVFQLITVGIAVATGFGAFKLKKVSAILSNFLALFSSAMQFATMTIVADQVDGTFIWPNLTPAWWAFALGAVAIFSLVLSRLSKNFGWKAIAVVNITGTGLFFVMGAMREWLQNSTFVFSLTLIAFTAFMLAQILASRYLRGLTNEIPKGKNAAYEKELAEREDSALRRYALAAVSLFVVVSIGYAVYIAGFDPTSMKNLWEPWTTILFGLIWIALALRPKFWAADFSNVGKTNSLIETIAWVVGYSATALGLSRLASSTGNSWASLAVNVLGVSALILIPKFVAKFSPNPLAIDVAMWMSFATGLLWTASDWSWSDSFGGSYLVAFALAFTLNYWANGRGYLSLVSSASASLGAIWLLFTIANASEGNQVLSLVALGMLAVVNLIPQVQRRVAEAAKADFAETSQNGIAIASSAVIVATMLFRAADTVAGSIWILVSLFAYLLAAFTLSQRALKADSKASPITHEIHSFIAQFGILFTLGATIKAEVSAIELLPITLTLLVLTALNYVYSLVTKRSHFVQIGYLGLIATSVSALYVLPQELAPSLHLGAAVVITALVAYLHLRLSQHFKQSDANNVWLIPTLGSVALMVVGLVIASQGATVSNADTWSNVAVIATGTLLTLIWFELRKGKKHEVEARLASALTAINAVAGIVLVGVMNQTMFGPDQATSAQQIIIYVVASLVIVRVNLRERNGLLMAFGFATNLVIGINVAIAIRLMMEGSDIPELYALSLAASLVASAYIFSKQLAARKTLVIDGAVIGALGFSSALSLASGLSSEFALIRGIVELVLLSAYAYFKAVAGKSIIWFAIGYVGGIGSAVLIVNELANNLEIEWHGAEFHSIAVILSMLIGNRILRRIRAVTSVDFSLGLPVAVLAIPMLSQGFLVQFGTVEGFIRSTIGLVLITAYAYFRAVGSKSIIWFAIGYVGGIGTAVLIVTEVARHLNIDWHGAEFHSIAIIVSLMIGNQILKKIRDVNSVDFRWGVPLGVLALPMASQGFLAQNGTVEGFIRLTIGMLLLTAYAYWRTGDTKHIGWLSAGYALGGLSALTISSSISTLWLTEYRGPELLSVLLVGSISIGHRYLPLVRKTESTLLLWGLPAAALILPSALYTGTASALTFAQLDAEQIIRAVAVLAVSALSLLGGLRGGNRGLAYSGVLGLAVITWIHAGLVAPAAVVEFRSLVIGAVLMTALNSLKNAGKLRGNSIVWLGIPIAVAMIPAIFNSLAALANSELTTVDWWRFGLVVTASAVLLIAGSLREIAGMFFPGLIGVVLAALPYGFKRVQQESWFLWVLLLAIAGIMVWIAVRMDQLRKQGKSSTAWLKELK